MSVLPLFLALALSLCSASPIVPPPSLRAFTHMRLIPVSAAEIECGTPIVADGRMLRRPDGRPMGGLKIAKGANSQRDPPFAGARGKSAALARRAGRSRAGALASQTLDAARLLGVDDRVGSLEPGKDGELALYDGDPFEYTSHCLGVVIEGRLVSNRVR